MVQIRYRNLLALSNFAWFLYLVSIILLKLLFFLPIRIIHDHPTQQKSLLWNLIRETFCHAYLFYQTFVFVLFSEADPVFFCVFRREVVLKIKMNVCSLKGSLACLFKFRITSFRFFFSGLWFQ